MLDDKNRLAKGLLVGFVAGAIITLLTSPGSGKELRSNIKKKAEDLKDGAMGFARAVGKKLRVL